jgi:hypothetical protein
MEKGTSKKKKSGYRKKNIDLMGLCHYNTIPSQLRKRQKKEEKPLRELSMTQLHKLPIPRTLAEFASCDTQARYGNTGST